MASNLDVMRIALRQYAYKESPAGSNNTKYGKAFGMNGQPWCFIFEWWCGEQAEVSNPFPHNANAAYGQDEIVTKKGGKWVMEKTASNATKKKGLSRVKYGDCVDFDFGKGNKYRQHTALAVGRSGDYYVCIEGNTSFGDSGSQSNGGCVALRFRHYTQVCSIARPKYKVLEFPKPTTAFVGTVPKIPSRGAFKYGDNGAQVKKLQKALAWANVHGLKADGDFGSNTFAEVVIFQVANGLKPDGQFGKTSLAKLEELIGNSTSQKPENRPADSAKPSDDVITHPKLYSAKNGDLCYDLSNWQGKLSVEYFKGIKKKGVKCVVLRSSYSKLASPHRMFKDDSFDHNVKNAIKAGMHIGSYHFSSAITASEAAKEADFCLKCVEPYKAHIDLPIAFDCEFGESADARFTARKAKNIGKAGMWKIVAGFTKKIKAAGYEPMLYANLTMFNNYLPSNAYQKIKIWVAQYYSKCQYNHPYYLWQFTSNNGKLDENKFGKQG